MIVCPSCKKPVKYIASKDNTILIVNAELKTLVNERGRFIQGYELHECPCEVAAKTIPTAEAQA
ncbi:hypothetical protein FUT79_05115 [Treponema phagedenis]|uniref:hypothetical protein n=1 Tax=Treponema phagedenis TaxID=162 RepID=UPI0011E66239|nr:hypothetical protein [Treponema phagedenis]QEJ94642.1 hypothetical protein FUT79_05115 [Treponema phagedenis]